MAKPTIECLRGPASPFTYLAPTQIQAIARDCGADGVAFQFPRSFQVNCVAPASSVGDEKFWGSDWLRLLSASLKGKLAA